MTEYVNQHQQHQDALQQGFSSSSESVLGKLDPRVSVGSPSLGVGHAKTRCWHLLIVHKLNLTPRFLVVFYCSSCLNLQPIGCSRRELVEVGVSGATVTILLIPPLQTDNLP